MVDSRRLGFVGVGLMGGGMARNLTRAGYTLDVFDIDTSKVEALKPLGARTANSPKEVGQRCEIVFSSLPDPKTVKEVYLGTGGVIEGALSGSIFIDMSTVDPGTSRTICEAVAGKNVKYLDAPVSGGPREAENGNLIIMVGGDQEAFDRCKGILEILGSTVHYAGPSGAGNVVKLVNNVMSMGNVAIAAEAFILGVKGGVDPQRLLDILRTGGGRSHHFEKRFPNILMRNFEPGFTVDLAKKDLGLALEMARNFAVPMPSTSLVHQLYSAISSIGDGQKDMVAIIKLFESWAGVQAKA